MQRKSREEDTRRLVKERAVGTRRRKDPPPPRVKNAPIVLSPLGFKAFPLFHPVPSLLLIDPSY